MSAKQSNAAFLIARLNSMPITAQELSDIAAWIDDEYFSADPTAYIVGKAAAMDNKIHLPITRTTMTKEQFFTELIDRNESDARRIQEFAPAESLTMCETPDFIMCHFRIKDKKTFYWGYVIGVLFAWCNLLNQPEGVIPAEVTESFKKYALTVLSIINADAE